MFHSMIREPSTYAGLSVVVNAIPQLIANPADIHAWGVLLGGIAAMLMKERAAQ